MKTISENVFGSARVPRAVFGVAPNTRGDLGKISGTKFSAGRLDQHARGVRSPDKLNSEKS
jgi:hypothetical protein